MNSQKTKPLNITINGSDMMDKTNNSYEKYIIKNNEQFQKKNNELNICILKLENTIQEKEDELEKEEEKRIYMKGLMHNLYEIKTKSIQSINTYDEIYPEFFEYFENYKSIFFNLDKYFNSKNVCFIFTLYLIIPNILSCMVYYISNKYYLYFSVLYQICLFLSMSIIIKSVYNLKFMNQFQKYKLFETKYKNNMVDIRKLKKGIKELEASVTDIHIIIDNS